MEFPRRELYIGVRNYIATLALAGDQSVSFDLQAERMGLPAMKTMRDKDI